MELNKITKYKHLAYLRYKYENLLGLKVSDEKSMQLLDSVYVKLNSLFEELKNLTFNPINIFTSLEELRSDKGLVSFKKFNEEQILEYLTDDERKCYDNLKFGFEGIKNTDKFIISSKNENKSYCFKKSNLKDIYELNIINTKDVAKTLALSNLPTYIIKIKDTDFKKNTINITYLDDYKDINVKLGDKKTILINYITDMSISKNTLKNDNVSKTISEEKLEKLTINDFEFIEPQVTKTDMKNITIPEIDDENLFFALNLKKTENLLNELNKYIVVKENYELKAFYNMTKNEFFYAIYDNKNNIYLYDNDFTKLIKSNSDLSSAIEAKFRLEILKTFKKVNDLILTDPNLKDSDTWNVNSFKEFMDDYKNVLDDERDRRDLDMFCDYFCN